MEATKDQHSFLSESEREYKTYSFRPFGIKLFDGYFGGSRGWIRVFGKGIKWKDTAKHYLTFSQRHGKAKGFNVLKWRIGFLS